MGPLKVKSIQIACFKGFAPAKQLLLACHRDKCDFSGHHQLISPLNRCILANFCVYDHLMILFCFHRVFKKASPNGKVILHSFCPSFNSNGNVTVSCFDSDPAKVFCQ